MTKKDYNFLNIAVFLFLLFFYNLRDFSFIAFYSRDIILCTYVNYVISKAKPKNLCGQHYALNLINIMFVVISVLKRSEEFRS